MLLFIKYQPFKILIFIILSFLYFPNINGQKKIKLSENLILKPLNAKDTLLLAKDCDQRRHRIAQYLEKGVILINNNENTSENFFYLTGWNSKPASCFIEINRDTLLTLFIPNNTAQSIIWNGKIAGKEDALKLGANSMHIFDLKKQLKALIRDGKKLYMLSQDKTMAENLNGLLKTKSDSSNIVYIDSLFSQMRIQKSNYEIQNIKKAIDVTDNALFAALKATRPQMYEYEIEALFKYEYTKNGANEGFKSIVGSGINSTFLHYNSNNKVMNSGDVLLLDVGAKYNGYSADITRTIPVNGKFTNEQLTLYNIVLKAQVEGIKTMKPGNSMYEFEKVINNVIIRELYKLGFITDSTKFWQKRIFIPSSAGHNLGLNVHDVYNYNQKLFLPGMVFTVEPGIYINPEMLKFIYEINGNNVSKNEMNAYVEKVKPLFEKYANIGIRIEDDVLITNTGNEVLSSKIPKDSKEVERLMRNNRR